MITAFMCDILQLCPSLQQQQQQEKEQPEQNIGSTTPASNATLSSAIELPPEGWMELKKRLYTLKQQLLSIHANDSPSEAVENATSMGTTTKESVDIRRNNHNLTMIDEQLSNHVMMTTDFDTVMTLLSVQEILASFREQLEDIKEDLEENDEEPGTDKNHSNSRINKLVETCVSTFMQNLTNLFSRSDTLNTTIKDDH